MDIQISVSKDDISVDIISDVLIKVNNFDLIFTSNPKSIEKDETMVTIRDNTDNPQIIPVIIRIKFSFLFI